MSTISTQKAPFEPPCIVYDVPEDDYHAMPGVSSGKLRRLLRDSPLHAGLEIEETDAMNLGTLVHALVLEPEKAERTYVVKPDVSLQSNAGKQQYVDWLVAQVGREPSRPPDDLATGKALSFQIADLEAAFADSGKRIVTQSQLDTGRACRDSLRDLDDRFGMLIDGFSEVTAIARDPRTQLLCRVRADHVPNAYHVLVDIKTMGRTPTAEQWNRTALNSGYHIQAAFYRHVYALAEDVKARQFLFATVETSPPYDACFYEMPEAELAEGTALMEQALDRWRWCEENRTWPGTAFNWQTKQTQIRQTVFPNYAFKAIKPPRM